MSPQKVAELAEKCINNNLTRSQNDFFLNKVGINPLKIENSENEVSYLINVIKYLSSHGLFEKWLAILARDGFIFAKDELSKVASPNFVIEKYEQIKSLETKMHYYFSAGLIVFVTSIVGFTLFFSKIESSKQKQLDKIKFLQGYNNKLGKENKRLLTTVEFFQKRNNKLIEDNVENLAKIKKEVDFVAISAAPEKKGIALFSIQGYFDRHVYFLAGDLVEYDYHGSEDVEVILDIGDHTYKLKRKYGKFLVKGKNDVVMKGLVYASKQVTLKLNIWSLFPRNKKGVPKLPEIPKPRMKK
ncbi:hypothetical protein [Candidatus Uabimicrobium sp. HlEnr_7]|uniref:hypothetical protein n=1 Tax=Candidatus Uabimicrobium helgolandensis TaxID=3095367 RepID=UPI003558EC3E